MSARDSASEPMECWSSTVSATHGPATLRDWIGREAGPIRAAGPIEWSDVRRFMNATGYRPPPWAAMIAELAADPTPYDEWTTQWTSIERDRSTASTS